MVLYRYRLPVKTSPFKQIYLSKFIREIIYKKNEILVIRPFKLVFVHYK